MKKIKRENVKDFDKTGSIAFCSPCSFCNRILKNKYLAWTQCTVTTAHTTTKKFSPFPSEVKRRKKAKKSDPMDVDIFDILTLFFHYKRYRCTKKVNGSDGRFSVILTVRALGSYLVGVHRTSTRALLHLKAHSKVECICVA